LLSTDTARIISLVAAILLLALGGIELGRVVSADLLRAEAESTAITWAATLQTAADEIPSMIAGAAPSARTERLLKDASHLGDVYRFRIWSRDGRLVFTSERFNSIAKPAGIASRYGKRIADSVIAGSPFTRVRTGGEPGVPHDFSVSCIPIRRNGLVIGVVEVYMDQTGDRNLYEKFLLLTEIIIVIAVLLAGGLPAYMVYRKMEAHRAAQAEAMFLAENDSLTGIPNRRRLGEAAKSALSSARRSKTHVAALLLDVDKFKDINDSFGHAAGDEVLRTFAARLRSAIREEDMVARLGGDEFVVLQVGIGQPDGAAHLAERLLNILSKPYDIGGSHLACRASIGIATAPADAEDWDKLLSCADAALYKSKASGRNAACFFEVGMDAAIRDRWRLEADLRRALEANAFQLAFQPLFNFRERNLVGFEALLRWPEGWEPRSPADFIPIAEESGLIVPIGAWVLETACRTASAWTRPLKVAVNLSPVQFRDGDIAAVVKAALLTSGLDPARLELEVTESLWIQNTDSVLAQLGELRSMGISIALDDFGAGYSSLTYLWRFDFDKVKIDRSFVREMNLDPKAEAIVNSIVALGKTLDLTITAEGVETEAQAEMLNDAGCDQAQGYLFGRPLSIPLADALANAEPGSVMRGMGPTP
jgi:diguanylate cyclase (GGDEF)-like protein